jgi:antirestriction protein ArdC
METTTQKAKRDVYAVVTDRIIEQLEKGTVPWRKPWRDGKLPQNLITERVYRGINVWLLSMNEYDHNYFLTMNQLNEIGGSVKKGEKANTVVFWNWKEVRKVPFLRYYLVFNIAQCQNIPEEYLPEETQKVVNPIKECEYIIENMPQKPEVKQKEKKAYYNPLLDFVNMPKMNVFNSSEDYYETYFHELIHSTGHISRLNRNELMQMEEFGSEPYSIEELTAEMGACYLLSLCGLGNKCIENNAAYIQGWLTKLKNDKRFIIYASVKAQQAVDFILKFTHKENEPAIEEKINETVVPSEIENEF